MFTCPSIAPSDSFIGTSGGVKAPAPLLPESPPSEPPLDVPQAVTPSASSRDTAIVVVLFMGSPR